MSELVAAPSSDKNTFMQRFLNTIENTGNKLPDPAMMFAYGVGIVFVLSLILSRFTWDFELPSTGEALMVNNLLDPAYLAEFVANMVPAFVGFAPLGISLVAVLGVGVSEHSGFINTALKKIMSVTPARALTPALVLVGILSHAASDAGYVLVIPIGGVIFYAAGRHPMAGIAAAFAGVSGGFSASFVPSAVDPLLQGFTQSAAQLYDLDYLVNPLCNFFFTASSSLLVVAVGWYVTDRIVEPRLNSTLKIDDDIEDAPEMDKISELENRAFRVAGTVLLLCLAIIAVIGIPETSPMRDAEGSLTSFSAPMMRSIVPFIFFCFVLPGVVYGRIAGTFKSSRDVMNAMTKSMSGMGSYLVIAFFCAQFLVAFGDSNLGTLLALAGAEGLKAMNMPGQMTVVGVIMLSGFVNLVVGSASAKWALIGPIFIPMLMAVGISPELTQAAYRIGDSSTNIITPLLPYFPLILVFCKRYIKDIGIGSVVSTMMPYSIALTVLWTIYLLVYWALGLPLGIAAGYTYPAM